MVSGQWSALSHCRALAPSRTEVVNHSLDLHPLCLPRRVAVHLARNNSASPSAPHSGHVRSLSSRPRSSAQAASASALVPVVNSSTAMQTAGVCCLCGAAARSGLRILRSDLLVLPQIPALSAAARSGLRVLRSDLELLNDCSECNAGLHRSPRPPQEQRRCGAGASASSRYP